MKVGIIREKYKEAKKKVRSEVRKEVRRNHSKEEYQRLKKRAKEIREKVHEKYDEKENLVESIDDHRTLINNIREKLDGDLLEKYDEIQESINDLYEKKEEFHNKIDQFEETEANHTVETEKFKITVIMRRAFNFDTSSYLIDTSSVWVDTETGREYKHWNVFDGGDSYRRTDKDLKAYVVDKERYDGVDEKNLKVIRKIAHQGIRM